MRMVKHSHRLLREVVGPLCLKKFEVGLNEALSSQI